MYMYIYIYTYIRTTYAVYACMYTDTYAYVSSN